MELNPESIVEKSIQKARKAVSVILFVSGCILLVLLTERAFFQSAHSTTVEELMKVQIIADEIRILDEKLTMSANMAAATGDTLWIKTYRQTAPKIEKSIEQATAMTPPEIAAKFHRETWMANEKLVELELEAIAYAQKGYTNRALQVMKSEEYQSNKEILASGTK